MARGSAAHSSRRWFDLAALIMLLGYLLNTIMLAVAARPAASGSATGILHWYEDFENPWPIAAEVILGVGAFLAYWWPRREEKRSFSLLATAALGFTTLLLGLASYWSCPSGQAAFWTPLTRALNLVLGGVNDSCGFPLALQTARLSGPLLLVVTALGVLAAVFRAQRDRLAVRWARQVVLVTGLAPDTIATIRGLALDRPRGTAVAVLADAADSGAIRSVRRSGARVLSVDSPDDRGLRVLLVAGSRLKITEAHLLSGDVAGNLRWAAALRALAAGCVRGSSSLAPRLLVRIDDPWQAEYWRRGNAIHRGDAGGVGWVCDAVSQSDVTARLVVHRLLQGFHDRVALVGGSTLALSICAELSQCAREDRLLDRTPHQLLTKLVLVGPAAARLRQLHQLWQQRFRSVVLDPDVISGSELTSLLEQSLAGAARPAVVLADDGSSAIGSELAVTHPGWTVFARSTATRGVSPTPVLEGLLPFGLTTELPPGWPSDVWERAARVAHERYRLQAPPGTPTNVAWTALDRFVRESNVRLVTTTLGSVQAIGRTWLPTGPIEGAAAAGSSLTEPQLYRLSELEHESWRSHLTENGWRWGPTRNRARKTHPALRPWAELAEADRARTLRNVQDVLATLEALGYHSSPRIRGTSTWSRFVRSGEVLATRSVLPWTWRTPAGAVMQAEAGDWRVSDATEVWSVIDEIFTRTYEHLGGDRWRRVGEVSGRPAIPGEIVHSYEGDETAGANEWVLRGAAGDEWIVTASHLLAHYRVVESPSEVDELAAPSSS